MLFVILTYEASCSSSEPHLLTPGYLNNLLCDTNLSKRQAELLSSRPKGSNLLHQDNETCFFCNCQNESKEFFSQELFTDPSKVKLTAVPLHHGNKFPSVPAAHAANTTESYQNMKILL
jgi:hypothetical protein